MTDHSVFGDVLPKYKSGLFYALHSTEAPIGLKLWKELKNDNLLKDLRYKIEVCGRVVASWTFQTHQGLLA